MSHGENCLACRLPLMMSSGHVSPLTAGGICNKKTPVRCGGGNFTDNDNRFCRFQVTTAKLKLAASIGTILTIQFAKNTKVK